MNSTLTCKVSLSKKLRSLFAEEEPSGSISLTVSDIHRGIGIGTLSITSDLDQASADKIATELRLQETSIMITPLETEDAGIPSGRVVSSLFANIRANDKTESTVIKKIAATKPPEKEHVAYAIVEKQNVQTPNEFKETDSPKYRQYVDSLQSLVAAVDKAKCKVADIDFDKITDPRKKAVALEMQEQLEAIDQVAYIVNDKVGCLTLNDLDLRLPLNMPFDLSKISAKRIAKSRELKEMVNQGFIKFISPDQVDTYRQIAVRDEATKIPSLDVYDNHEQAGDAIGTMGGDTVATSSNKAPSFAGQNMEVSESNMNDPTEEESMIINLTNRQTPSNVRSTPSVEGGTRKTVHGSSSIPNHAPQQHREASPNGNSSLRPIVPKHR
ncbi:MAG: hypothetical protein WC375_03595 [Methanomassiliicoccales archaeon]|jgi:hypothetical protein